jgi:hypothetical protein
LKKSIDETLQNLKSVEDVGGVLLEMAWGIARKAYKKLLELLDGYLFNNRDGGLKSEGFCARWVLSPLGGVLIRRRKYRDDKGGYRYLLDEIIGIEGRSPITPELKEGCAYLVTLLPFMKSAQVLETMQPEAVLSHTTMHQIVKRIARPVIEQEEKQRRQVYEGGGLEGGGDRVVSRLFVEGDGVNIALQREKRKKAEVKVAVAYEGWQEASKERYGVTGKTSYCGIASGSSFWELFSLKLSARYDLVKTGGIVVGGDGAGWVKSGANLLGGRFQLDRFHLSRALRRALGKQPEMIGPIYRACNEGDLSQMLKLLDHALDRARGKEREDIASVKRYLTDNADGLKDYRLDLGEAGVNLRRTGAIESNVDKLAANRLKKKGMSWRIHGARYMLCLLTASAEKRLSQICRPRTAETLRSLPVKKMRRTLVKNYKAMEEKWLQGTLPALYGPHVNHPWVKALKHLSEVSLNL